MAEQDDDLRSFPFFPIEISRLFGSEFHALANDAEWRAGVTLWLKSFHQTPAGSLPDNETALCRLAELGSDLKKWRKVKSVALRNWVNRSDGRLYHHVVAEKVHAALKSKHRTKPARDAKEAKRRLRALEQEQGAMVATTPVTTPDTEAVSDLVTATAAKVVPLSNRDGDRHRDERQEGRFHKKSGESSSEMPSAAARAADVGGWRPAGEISAQAMNKFRKEGSR